MENNKEDQKPAEDEEYEVNVDMTLSQIDERALHRVLSNPGAFRAIFPPKFS